MRNSCIVGTAAWLKRTLFGTVLTLGLVGAAAAQEACPLVELQDSDAAARRDVGVEVIDAVLELGQERQGLRFSLRFHSSGDLADFDVTGDLEFQYAGEPGVYRQCLVDFRLTTVDTRTYDLFVPISSRNGALPPGTYSIAARVRLEKGGVAYRDRSNTGAFSNQDVGSYLFARELQLRIADLEEGDGEWSANITVENSGDNPSGPIRLAWTPDAEDVGASEDLPSLAAGDSIVLARTFPGASEEIRVVALDPNDFRLGEARAELAGGGTTTADGVDLEVEHVSVQADGGEHYLTAIIRNVGTAGSEDPAEVRWSVANLRDGLLLAIGSDADSPTRGTVAVPAPGKAYTATAILDLREENLDLLAETLAGAVSVSHAADADASNDEAAFEVAVGEGGEGTGTGSGEVTPPEIVAGDILMAELTPPDVAGGHGSLKLVFKLENTGGTATGLRFEIPSETSPGQVTRIPYTLGGIEGGAETPRLVAYLALAPEAWNEARTLEVRGAATFDGEDGEEEVPFAATFTHTHDGAYPRPDLELALEVDGVEVTQPGGVVAVAGGDLIRVVPRIRNRGDVAYAAGTRGRVGFEFFDKDIHQDSTGAVDIAPGDGWVEWPAVDVPVDCLHARGRTSWVQEGSLRVLGLPAHGAALAESDAANNDLRFEMQVQDAGDCGGVDFPF